MTVESILADLIRIRTVNPPGGETEAAKYLKSLFDQYGIPNEIVEPSPGRGSFIAYLGEGKERLLYVSHIDVVPAAEDWSFAPFAGEIRDGFVYGRGALDCKGLVAAQASALINLAKNTKLKGRLIFAATADEEAGGALGARYLVENCRDKIVADFAINEGAEAPTRIGDTMCYFLGVGEKGPAWLNVKAKGSSAHGSLPMLGVNAVVKMAEAIKNLASYKPKVIMIPEAKRLLQTVAKLQGLDKDITESNVDEVIQQVKDKVFAGYLTAITRMTVSPNVIRGGLRGNIVPDNCEAEVDIRVLPGQDKEYVVSEIGRLIGDLEIAIAQYSPPTFSSSNSESYRLVSDTFQEFVGDARILPSITSGATDSRFLRRIGIPSYGIGMIARNPDPQARLSVHGKDEKVDIESLQRTSDFLVRLARRYLGD